jgi:hypothetical protein
MPNSQLRRALTMLLPLFVLRRVLVLISFSNMAYFAYQARALTIEKLTFNAHYNCTIS